MPESLKSIRPKVSSSALKEFRRLLDRASQRVGRTPDSLKRPVFRPHRFARPAEYHIQERLALHPICEYLPLIEDAYDPDVALASWIDACEGKLGGANQSMLLEALLIARQPEGLADVLSAAVHSVLAGKDVPQLTAPTLSSINLLSSSPIGPPHAQLLERVVERIEPVIKQGSGTLSPPWPAIASLLWRALDARVIGSDDLAAMVARQPDVLRLVESHQVVGNMRVTADVPERSLGEAFLTRLCLDRLDAMTDAGDQHSWGGAFKGVLLWPGPDVFLAALRRMETFGGLTRDEFRETPAASLWHILRHTRPRSDGEMLAAKRLEPFSVETLIHAAIVAPWWAPDIEEARNWPGLTSLIGWCYAHARWALGGNEPLLDTPRIERQVAELYHERGVRTQAERDSGIFERAWLTEAIDQLPASVTRKVVQSINLAFRNTTRLAEPIQAVLGEGHSDIWNEARQGRAISIKMLGLLSSGSVEERLDIFSDHWKRQEPAASAKRVAERRVATIGATNLAETDGVADPLLLAWQYDRNGIEVPPIVTPLDLGQYRIESHLGRDGVPALAVVRVSKSGERTLKMVPRDVAENPDFRKLRQAFRDLQDYAGYLRETLERRLLMGLAVQDAVLAGLLEQPMGKPIVENLVFESDDHAGFPRHDGDGVALLTRDGKLQPLAEGDAVTLLNPLDLSAGELKAWREHLIANQIVQPFPQIFRGGEIPARAKRGKQVNAYAGVRVNVVAATDLLESMYWEVGIGRHPRKAYRDAGLIAWWQFVNVAPHAVFAGVTAETGTLFFTRIDDPDVVAQPVSSVPDEVLADTMRDLAKICCDACVEVDTANPTLALRREMMAAVIDGAWPQRIAVDADASDEIHVAMKIGLLDKSELLIKLDVQTGRLCNADNATIDLGLPEAKEPLYMPHPPAGVLSETLGQLGSLVDAMLMNRKPVLDRVAKAVKNAE
jgi:hypothetical protein